jgi:AcrR family transcriptional regulator
MRPSQRRSAAPRPRPRTAAPRRRTQAERRSATSSLLLEAAIACLVERGYAATTTLEVARRAGVSQGALFKHYPTKVALLVAAVERLYARLRDDFRRDLAEAEQRRDRIRAALELLDSVFARAEVTASLELHMAARTDDDLRAAFAPIAGDHHRRILELARELFPGATVRDRRFDTFIELALAVLQGAAVGALAQPARAAHPELLDALEWLARRELGQAIAPETSGAPEIS